MHFSIFWFGIFFIIGVVSLAITLLFCWAFFKNFFFKVSKNRELDKKERNLERDKRKWELFFDEKKAEFEKKQQFLREQEILFENRENYLTGVEKSLLGASKEEIIFDIATKNVEQIKNKTALCIEEAWRLERINIEKKLEEAFKVALLTTPPLLKEIPHETTIALLSAKDKGKIIGKQGRNLRAIQHITGVKLYIDETSLKVSVNSLHPFRRVWAAGLIEEMVQLTLVTPEIIESLAERIKDKIELSFVEKGREAFLRLSLTVPSERVAFFVGRMELFYLEEEVNLFNKSFFLAEVAQKVACELSLDASIMGSAALLLDIGKTLESRYKASHEESGARFCEKHLFSPAVVNAILGHHGKVVLTSPEGVLVKMLDERFMLLNDVKTAFSSIEARELEDIACLHGAKKAYAAVYPDGIDLFVHLDKKDKATQGLFVAELAKKIKENNKLSREKPVKIVSVAESKVVEKVF